MDATTNPPRLLTPEELGAVIKAFRDVRKWSQEQLAEVAGLSSRTVQRVENGKPVAAKARQRLTFSLN